MLIVSFKSFVTGMKKEAGSWLVEVVGVSPPSSDDHFLSQTVVVITPTTLPLPESSEPRYLPSLFTVTPLSTITPHTICVYGEMRTVSHHVYTHIYGVCVLVVVTNSHN
jgi:hypothetical protein